MEKEPIIEEWEETVPLKMRSDPLGKSVYYRLAMYLYDLTWQDCIVLKKDFRGREIVCQLVRSTVGICANLVEAYGRALVLQIMFGSCGLLLARRGKHKVGIFVPVILCFPT